MLSSLSRPLSTWSRTSTNQSLEASKETPNRSPIMFSQDWDSKIDPIFGWYQQLSCATFTTIQYRREYKAPFHHEFLCAKLGDGDLCRLERFGDPDARTDAVTKSGSVAQDLADIYPADYLDALNRESEVLLEVNFQEEVDLMHVLEICYNIQKDDRARTYTLQRYNCYFFCWCVLTVLTRECMYHEDTPSQEMPPSYQTPPPYQTLPPTSDPQDPQSPEVHGPTAFEVTYPTREDRDIYKPRTDALDGLEMGMEVGKGIGRGMKEGAKKGLEMGKEKAKRVESKRGKLGEMMKGMAKGMAKEVFHEVMQTKMGKWLEGETNASEFYEFIQARIDAYGSRVELARLGKAEVVRSEVRAAIEGVWRAMLIRRHGGGNDQSAFQ